MCVLNTFWRIVSPLVVGRQLSLQTEQMSFNRPTLLKTETQKNTDILEINIETKTTLSIYSGKIIDITAVNYLC